MEYFYIVGLILLIGIVVVFLVLQYLQKKDFSFVNENSQAIADLKRINEKYHFHTLVLPVFAHTYDNEFFYNNISCRDYLIYQLQFSATVEEINQQIEKFHLNQQLYPEYSDELLKQIQPGFFNKEPKERKKEKYLNIEKKILADIKLKPMLDFYVTVSLKRSDTSSPNSMPKT